jgi:hypothetical protein
VVSSISTAENQYHPNKKTISFADSCARKFYQNKALLIIIAGVAHAALLFLQRPLAGILAGGILFSKNSLLTKSGVATTVGVTACLILFGIINLPATWSMATISCVLARYINAQHALFDYCGRSEMIYDDETDAYRIRHLEWDSKGEDQECKKIENDRNSLSKAFSETYLCRRFSQMVSEWRLPAVMENSFSLSCFKVKNRTLTELKEILNGMAITFLVSAALHKIVVVGAVIAFFGVIAGSMQAATWEVFKHTDKHSFMTYIAATGSMLILDLMLSHLTRLRLVPIFTIATLVGTALFRLVPSMREFAIDYWSEPQVKPGEIEWEWDKHFGTDTDLVGRAIENTEFVKSFKDVFEDISNLFSKKD